MSAAWPRELLRRPGGVLGVVVLAVLIVSAVVATFWTPQDPFATDPFHRWQGPSGAHLLGTDGVGRDVFSYVFAASRTALLVAVLSSLVAGVVGVVLAAVGALGPRWLREPVAVLIDVLIAFPVLLIAIMLSAVLGPSLTEVVVAVGIGFGVNIARVARGEIRRVARSGYVLAARAAGLGPGRVLTDHLLPNIAPVLIVQLSLSAGVAVLSEAGLSFLGYGAPPSTPSWGRLLGDLQNYVTIYPLTAVWPGLAITVSVLACNLFGDALREATDPRLRTGRRERRRVR
ncbi:ABC transporter permease [Amnibacterium soli]|uniref:ABC transporter permease n=1 Tax=Amnibacterium soli TaxID=1282736 RepID=A0ABP8Z9V1_9MICO